MAAVVSQPTGPTDSHILSQVEQDEKGLAQKPHVGPIDNTSDIGWGASPLEFEKRIVSGLSNEDLWMLIRRFNKQIYCVKSVPESLAQSLDLNRAADEDFSPDKLRATIERFYTVVVVELAGFVKHVARLRSWREPRRTSVFCIVYFVAWFLDLLAPTLISVLLALVIYPPSRSILFPHAPIPLVDKDTGGVQKPTAGVLGSHSSITGAPENFKGEAAEKEASNLMSSMASMAAGSVTGKHDQGTPDDAPMEKSAPDAMDVVSDAADAQASVHGEVPEKSHDKTRQPMKEVVLATAIQLMRGVNDTVDTYERFANALSPTPPFSSFTPYFRFSCVLAVSFAVSLVTSSHLFVKITTLVTGFSFFGDPIIQRGMEYLDDKYPLWRKSLSLENSLLKGIPTNAQLTLTLLRSGEANGSPIPPPPGDNHKDAPPPSEPTPINTNNLQLGASNEEIHDAASPAPPGSTPHEEPATDAPKPKHNFMSGLVNFFRGTTSTGLQSKLAVDRARAAAGSRHAKSRVGVLRRKGQTVVPRGPVHFDARYHGKRGAVMLDAMQDPPVVYFTTDPASMAEDQSVRDKKGNKSVLFAFPVTDIVELRKMGGLGWKGKLAAGWAVGGKEVVDGLVIVGKGPQERYQLTAMKTRNDLFNRLVAIDGQVWESY
ncbi:hypothetical protein P168DRAFT_286645 [Aspergillus campestris IBT 28561]|uniref:Uncharacterized protein n=1 Tax=Aspergillus campestris (strain IBT 28561) TaxID=1392248 RepID=A0A2I1DF79_ASPC2|nr:uncharacterized protein P168DRAFT_286645 [Aspergillus campestris IBT 28561]PKY08535.1 hypothetical protein P168DRAFT_286645 [Aspergillus campestris IBT 28561]